MTTINAYRMDGLGNDFIIVDRRKNSINISRERIIELGRRDVLGFDQIIFIEDEQNQSFPITIYNSDGGEVSACGNGSRCVAYLLTKEMNLKTIQLKTNNRLLEAEVVGNLLVKLNMGKPEFQWEKIPLIKDLNHQKINLEIDNIKFSNGFCLNVGNPHIVFFEENCFKHDLKRIGPKIENHVIFPEKVNVTFAQVEDNKNILINVWERGAGLTKACGTAACATAVAAIRKNLSDNKVNIKFKEGILIIQYNDKENIFMTGPVSEVKKIEIEI